MTPREQWLFTRVRGGDIEATLGTAVVARYESKLIAGGTIFLPDDSRLRLRPPVMGEVWRLRRGGRELVLDVRPMRVGWAMRLTSAEPLIAMFAFHAVLCELDVPSSGGGTPAGF